MEFHEISTKNVTFSRKFHGWGIKPGPYSAESPVRVSGRIRVRAITRWHCHCFTVFSYFQWPLVEMICKADEFLVVSERVYA